MLYLIFSLGPDRYALKASEVLIMLPVPVMKALPGTPAWVAGLAYDAQGAYPVIDLAALTLSRPSHQVMSTRLAQVAYIDRQGVSRRLGVIVERATSTLHADDDAFEPAGVATPESPFLGPVLRRDDGVIQRITIGDLLPSAVSDRLFAEAA